MKKASSPVKDRVKEDLAQLTANEAVKTKRFWLLWVMMFINISAGIMIISVASPMAQDMAGLSVAAAASMVGIMGIFNGAGRIGWAGISDYIGRPAVFSVFFIIQIIAFLILPFITHPVLFPLVIIVVMTCYGGGFASLPAFIGDMFGTKQLGAIHGYILTAWSMAGVMGPIAVSSLKEISGSYTPTFYLFTALLIIAFIVSLITARDVKKIRENNKQNSAA